MCGTVRCHNCKRHRPGVSNMADDTGHQQNSAEEMDYQVAHAGTAGLVRHGGPHHHGRGQGKEFPEGDHGDQVARKGDSNRAARAGEGSHELDNACAVEGEQSAREGHNGEHRSEQSAQPVAGYGYEFIFEKGYPQGDPVRNLPDPEWHVPSGRPVAATRHPAAAAVPAEWR